MKPYERANGMNTYCIFDFLRYLQHGSMQQKIKTLYILCGAQKYALEFY